MEEAIFWLKIFSAFGCAVIGGIFFAFSNFIMRALRGQPPAAGMSAMQAINVTVLNPLFLGVFVGTALICLALCIISIFSWQGTHSLLVIAGGLLYVVGCFGVTIAFNVPLNEGLAKADPSTEEGTALWQHYLRRWTTWNTIRTIASLLAAITILVAIRH